MNTELEFEWDADKAADNIRKHGLSFETATGVFFDPAVLIIEDDREEYGELREVAYGMVEASVLVVVHTERDGGVIRLISARLATALERRRYANG